MAGSRPLFPRQKFLLAKYATDRTFIAQKAGACIFSSSVSDKSPKRDSSFWEKDCWVRGALTGYTDKAPFCPPRSRVGEGGRPYIRWRAESARLLRRAHLMEASQLQSLSQARINVAIAESLLQRCERRLSRAMTRCNVVHFETIMQSSHDPVDLWIGRSDQVKAPDYEMNVRINRGRQFGKFVDTRMCTANNDD